MTLRNDGCETFWNCDHLVPGEDYVDWDLEDVMLFGTEKEKRKFLKERAKAEYKRTHREKMDLTTGEDWDTGRHYIYLVVPDLSDTGWHDIDEPVPTYDYIIGVCDDDEEEAERLREYCWLLHLAGVDFTVDGEEFDYHKHCFKQECDE